MPTEYQDKMNELARRTIVTTELLKKNNIVSVMSDNDWDHKYRCGCCHDKSDPWLSEWEAKKHIHTDKHTKTNKNYNTMKKKYETEYNKRIVLEEKVKKIEKELFQYNGSSRVESFLSECSEVDHIQITEDDEVTMPNGVVISRPISYWSAPVKFNDLYIGFCGWCDEDGPSAPSKEDVKSMMIKCQENSSYGLDIGEYDEQLKKNGTHENPKFNYKFESYITLN
tara:strand:+ start:243 stop:917 length:675 start_codon:yes stop_codon:yes gene_type:complete